jgi:tetratricopeptide (TPR) repeat protein
MAGVWMPVKAGREVKMDTKLKAVVVICVLLFGAVAAAHAAGTSSSSWGGEQAKEAPVVNLYDQGVAAHERGDYRKAMALFEQALRENRKNPDTLNMLAHTQLKLGLIDESLETYKKALALRSRFPEAREYLGEAYIQAALREVETLRSYGLEGNENRQDLIKALKEAAAKLE